MLVDVNVKLVGSTFEQETGVERKIVSEATLVLLSRERTSNKVVIRFCWEGNELSLEMDVGTSTLREIYVSRVGGGW